MAMAGRKRLKCKSFHPSSCVRIWFWQIWYGTSNIQHWIERWLSVLGNTNNRIPPCLSSSVQFLLLASRKCPSKDRDKGNNQSSLKQGLGGVGWNMRFHNLGTRVKLERKRWCSLWTRKPLLSHDIFIGVPGPFFHHEPGYSLIRGPCSILDSCILRETTSIAWRCMRTWMAITVSILTNCTIFFAIFEMAMMAKCDTMLKRKCQSI